MNVRRIWRLIHDDRLPLYQLLETGVENKLFTLVISPSTLWIKNPDGEQPELLFVMGFRGGAAGTALMRSGAWEVLTGL